MDFDILDLEELLKADSVATMQLPDPELLNYYRFAKHRMYYVNTSIDEDILDLQSIIIFHNLEDKGKPVEERTPVRIFINSNGGYISETFAICQTMVASKTPIYTINAGCCLSGGALMLISGHKRFAFKYSSALIHSGSGGTQGTYEQTKEQQKNYELQVNKMGKFVLERTKIDDKTWKKNKSKEWYLSDEEQVTYGVVHQLIESIDDIL